MEDSNGLQGLAAKVKQYRTCGEHEVLPELLEEALVTVTRKEPAMDPEFPDNSEITDNEILDKLDWDGADKRRKKWMWMAGDYLTRSKELPADRFNESACAVAIYMDGPTDSETIKSALKTSTFGEGTSVRIPREVLKTVAERVEKRDDVTLEDILEKHRETVGHDDAPIEVSQ